MLNDDVDVVYQFLKDEYGDTEIFPAMCRIKTALAELQNTSADRSIPTGSPCYWCTNCASDDCASCGPHEQWRYYLPKLRHVTLVKCKSCGCDGNQTCGAQQVDKDAGCALDENLVCPCCKKLGAEKNKERWHHERSA